MGKSKFYPLQTSNEVSILQTIEMERDVLGDNIAQLYQSINQVAARPVRDFWSRVAQTISTRNDGLISTEFKSLLESRLLPALDEALLAVQNSDADAMKIALAKFPNAQQWAKANNTAEGQRIKASIDALKNSLQKQIVAQENLPRLNECRDALEQSDITNALESLPTQNQLQFFTAQAELQGLKDQLMELESAVVSPSISLVLQQQRFATQLATVLQQIDSKLVHLEKKPSNYRQEVYESFIKQTQSILREIQFLKDEKTRLSDDPVDLSEFKPLEDRILAAAFTYSNSLYNMIDVTMARVKTAEDYIRLEENLANTFSILNQLEQCFGDSVQAERQKLILVDLKTSYAQLQNAYPKAVELGFKAEQLLLLIEEQCNKHLKDLKAPSRDEGIINTFWEKMFGEDTHFVDQKAKYIELTNFKAKVNDTSIPALQALADLAKKSPTLIEQALGLSPDQANIVSDALISYFYPLLMPQRVNANLEEQLDNNLVIVNAALLALGRPIVLQDQDRNVVEQQQAVELH